MFVLALWQPRPRDAACADVYGIDRNPRYERARYEPRG
jgi:hypothetical protein